MISFVFKRLALMVLTLFGVSMIIFIMINLMPGRPSLGGQVNPEGQSVDQLTTESDRRWRASFHLDKPIFLNFRPWLETQEVAEILEKRVAGMSQLDQDRGLEFTTAQLAVNQMQAEWRLDDWGRQAVGQLITIAADPSLDFSIRLRALRRLPANIERPKRIPNPDWFVDSQEYRQAMQWNQEVSEEKFLAQKHSLSKSSNPTREDVDREAQWWQEWFAKNQDRFVSEKFSDKLAILFFDTRYAHYFTNLLRGDFGTTMKKTRVIDEIFERLPLTLSLNVVAFFLIYLLALPIGIYAAVKRGGSFDVFSTIILFMLYSLPSFYVGMIMVKELTGSDLPSWLRFPEGDWEGADYEWLTTWGRFKDRLWHSFLPVICLVYGALAGLSRFARTGLLDIIESDYIRTARAKGLSESVVVLKHALRNGALPVLTLLAALLPGLFGGSVIVEVIFNLRGMGLLLFESIISQDYTIIAGIVMISSVLVVIGLFVVDILYTVVDPRIRFE